MVVDKNDSKNTGKCELSSNWAQELSFWPILMIGTDFENSELEKADFFGEIDFLAILTPVWAHNAKLSF